MTSRELLTFLSRNGCEEATTLFTDEPEDDPVARELFNATAAACKAWDDLCGKLVARLEETTGEKM